MTTPASQVQLTIVEDVLGELILLDAPATQVVVGTDLSDTAPLPIGTAAAGTSVDGARADHVHAHGDQTGTTLHAAATTSAAGFMSGVDKTKLDAATDANTASTLVSRDSAGDFAANEITADLIGNADTATALETARDIGGVSFDGTANINLPGVNTTGNQSVLTTGTIDAGSLASLANLMLAFATRGASIGEPGKLLFGVGPAVTGTTPVGIGPHDYYPIDLATGSFM
jgi:hypothetical protein